MRKGYWRISIPRYVKSTGQFFYLSLSSDDEFRRHRGLLQKGAPTDHRDINGLTPLYYSIIYKADLKVTKLLLNHQCSPQASSSNNTSSYSNGVLTANPLIQRASAIGIIDQHGWQETHQACKLGLDAHLEKLLYYGCDINARISGSGNTPLHVAAINDQLECAKVLLMRGARKTITNNSHQTAHQVAVISNNMDLAEFIAEHDESKVIPFHDRPLTCAVELTGGRYVQDHNLPRQAHHTQQQQQHQHHHRQHLNQAYQNKVQQTVKSSAQLQHTTSISNQSSTRSSVSSSHSMASLTTSNGLQLQPRAIVQPQVKYLPTSCNQLTAHMNPLSLDLADTNGGIGSLSNSSNSSTFNSSSQPQSLISTGGSSSSVGGAYTNNQQLCVHLNNVSPCLSQRSCATSNTTSSSGVCCDVDGNPAEDPQLYQHLANSQSQHSNITIINVGEKKSSEYISEEKVKSSQASQDNVSSAVVEDEDYDDDIRSSASSLNNGLNSLLFDEKPLPIGTIVEATSDYRSGDPSHLQLHRGVRVEVLECANELLTGGQLPRLANKPMFYGRIVDSNLKGLFPSFCVQRVKKKRPNRHSLKALTDVTSNINNSPSTIGKEDPRNSIQFSQLDQSRSLVESQSMIVIDRCTKQDNLDHSNRSHLCISTNPSTGQENDWRSKFHEVKVTLCKTNEGFGFVLRGAKVDMTTLAPSGDQEQRSVSLKVGSTTSNKLIIDERLMAANNLISLQYLDEIETGSVAYEAGLKRGDFLVAVNGQDVRLGSHEQVVQMIRQSGNQVHLTIATPIGNGTADQTQQQHHHQPEQIQHKQPQPSYTSRTLSRVKPEPPKRDPTTTLTRNRANRVKSMLVQPQLLMIQKQEQEHCSNPFDANKPLPMAPPGADIHALASPTGSLNMMSRSMSSNLMHFHSAQSLSSTIDTQSISSVSTISADHAQQDQRFFSSSSCSQHATPTQSSSSTATLTTVATAIKPKLPPKTTAIVAAAAASVASYLQADTKTKDCPSSTNATVSPPDTSDVVSGSSVAGITNNSDVSGAFMMNQPIYQPAVITTTSRAPQASLPKAQLTNSNGTTCGEETKSYKNMQPRPVDSTTLLPPPPPPLPDFSSQISRLNQRRTSAPIDATSLASIDKDTLLRKRESLTTIEQVKSSLTPSVNSQIGAVAAACAAAANNRLHRRQLEQQVEKFSGAKEPVIDKAPSLQTSNAQLKDESLQQNDLELPPPPPPPLSPALQTELAEDEQPVEEVGVDNTNILPQEKFVTTSSAHKQLVTRQQLSSTLGRKSSAQIIQQPKPIHCSQSQTMRHKPRRPSIPSYDEIPLPPAPTTTMDDSDLNRQPQLGQQLQLQIMRQNQQQTTSHVHGHPHEHNHQHYHQQRRLQQGLYSNHLPDNQSELYQDVALSKRHSHNIMLPQQQQSTLSQQQQQQILRQQLIQQHLLQQQQQLHKHQQQMMIQQQIQMQHRDVQRRHETVEHDRIYQCDQLHHQLHNQAQHRLSQPAVAQGTIEQQLLHRQIQQQGHLHHHGHHSHHHQTTQGAGGNLKARAMVANRSQHQHHHHHHHHQHHNHNVQEHQTHHLHGHRSYNGESHPYF